MAKKFFTRQELLDILYEDNEDSKIIKNEMYESGRWTTYYDFIFELDGKYYQTSYGRGSTECQDESPWEYDGDKIECIEVEPYEKVVIDYQPVS